MTNPDATYKHHKPQNKKTTQNKACQFANATVVVLQLSKKSVLAENITKNMLETGN
jgi:hypothetical protein